MLFNSEMRVPLSGYAALTRPPGWGMNFGIEMAAYVGRVSPQGVT